MLKNTNKSNPAACHPDKKHYCKGMCRSCYEKDLLAKNPEYKQRQIENCRNWCKTNQAKKRESNKNWRAKQDKDYLRQQKFIRRIHSYGLTLGEYNNIVEAQNALCFICLKAAKPGKNLNIDHDHNTGKVRGLLCFRCNFGLTYFSENHENLQRAADYLKRSL